MNEKVFEGLEIQVSKTYGMAHAERLALTYTVAQMEADLKAGIDPTECAIKKWEAILLGGYELLGNCALCRVRYSKNDFCRSCGLYKIGESCNDHPDSLWRMWARYSSEYYEDHNFENDPLRHICDLRSEEAAQDMLEALKALRKEVKELEPRTATPKEGE